MEICLMIEGQEGVTWDEWMTLAGACDEAGLTGLFTSDHYLSFHRGREQGSLDAWTLLAALAGMPHTIRLGTLVSPVTFRHPSALAKAVVTADHVSGGRVELGMGAGWNEEEHRAYGFPFPPLGARMRMLGEQLEIVHQSWTLESLNFEGEHYTLADDPALPAPVQDPHPPLIVGGRGGPRALALAARWADEYDVFGADPDEVARVNVGLAEACRERDRDPAEVRLSWMGRLEGMSTPQLIDRLGQYRDAGAARAYVQHLEHRDLEFVHALGNEVLPALA